MESRVDSESRNSKRYRMVFFAVAIVGAAMAVTSYPDPKPLPPTPLPDNHIIIRIIVISENLDKFRQIHPGTGIIVSFHKVADDGQPSAQSLRTRTDSDGIARIVLYEGVYLVKISNWEPITVGVTNDTTIFVRRYEIQDRPTSVEILSLSKDWEIVPKDIMILTYRNRFPYPVFIESATFNGKEAISTICNPVQNRSKGEDGGCPVPVAVGSNQEWADSFEVPIGVPVPFEVAKQLSIFSLRVSYTEVRVGSQPP